MINMESKWCDRFIPKRINCDVANFNLYHSDPYNLDDYDIDNKNSTDHKEAVFINTAQMAEIILNHRKKLMNIMNITRCGVLNMPSVVPDVIHSPPWAVMARKHPLIKKPEVVLDMPYSEVPDLYSFRFIIDWSKKGELAAIFSGEVYLWSFLSSTLRRTNTAKAICHPVKWDKTGNLFAVCQKNYWCVVNSISLDVIWKEHCGCENICKSSSLNWTKRNQLLACCRGGHLRLFTSHKSFKLIEQESYSYIFNGDVEDVKLSPNDVNILITVTNGTKGTILNALWNGETSITKLVFYPLKFEYNPNLRSIEWHPWNDSLVAIGQESRLVTIWNVKHNKLVEQQYVKPYFKSTNCILDCLTFSKASGELVVSFYCQSTNNNYEGYNVLTVFKNLDIKVDEVRYHRGRVPHVIWDESGTKLASLGTDEALIIWNFFGNADIPKRKTPTNIINDFNMRYTIR